jgi:hypothetical protein
MDITESLITETSLRYNVRSITETFLRYNVRSINNQEEKEKSLERELGSEASD